MLLITQNLIHLLHITILKPIYFLKYFSGNLLYRKHRPLDLILPTLKHLTKTALNSLFIGLSEDFQPTSINAQISKKIYEFP